MAPSKILLIDDSPSIRTIIKLFLINHRVEFVEAKDGAEGLAVAGKGPLDLVIADFNMPVMDGLTFVQRLRAHDEPRLRKLPVILLTANKEPGIRAQAEAAGAVFAQKPVSREALTLAVGNLLQPAEAAG